LRLILLKRRRLSCGGQLRTQAARNFGDYRLIRIDDTMKNERALWRQLPAPEHTFVLNSAAPDLVTGSRRAYATLAPP